MKPSIKLICAMLLLSSAPVWCMHWFAKLCGSCTQQEMKAAPDRATAIVPLPAPATTDEVKTRGVQLSISTKQTKRDNAFSQLIVYDTKKIGIQKLLYNLITTLPLELIQIIVAYYYLHIPEGKLVKTLSIDMDEDDYIRRLLALSNDMLAVVTDKNALHIVDCNEGVCVKTYKERKNFRWFDFIEAKEGVIAFVVGDHLGLLDIKTNKCICYKIPFCEKYSYFRLFPASESPRGQLVVAMYKQSVLHKCALFNLNTLRWVVIECAFPYGTRVVFLTPELMAVMFHFHKNLNFLYEDLYFVDTETGHQIGRAQKGQNIFDSDLNNLQRLSDRLLVATNERSINIWDAQTGALVKSVATDCSFLTVHPSNLLMAEPLHGDNPVKLFNPITGSMVGEFKIDGAVTALSSGRLVMMLGRNDIKIWE